MKNSNNWNRDKWTNTRNTYRSRTRQERAQVKEHCHNLKVLRGFYKGRKALMEQAQAHCQRYPELDNELIKAYSLHLSFTDIYKVQEIIKKLDKVIAQYEPK